MPTRQTEHFALTDDCVVEIDRRDNDTWKLAFTDGSGAPVPLDLSSLIVEASSTDQKVRGLKLSPGDGPGHVLAIGWVECATHARVTLTTQGGRLERQFRFSDAALVRPEAGPTGGLYADMGHGSAIELVTRDGADWLLKFYLDGKENAAPPAELITVQAIDEDGLITAFPAKGIGGTTVLGAAVSGSPARVRLIWSHGDHGHNREFDLS